MASFKVLKLIDFIRKLNYRESIRIEILDVKNLFYEGTVQKFYDWFGYDSARDALVRKIQIDDSDKLHIYVASPM